MMEYWIAGAAMWIACGILAYGRFLAHWQREFPSIADECQDSDRGMSFALALAGPLALPAAFACCRRHGFMWRLPQRGS